MKTTDFSSSTGGAAKKVRHATHAAAAFWQRVTEGIELQDLWGQFKAEARSSYGLYSRDVDWKKIGESSKWQRPFRIAWALFLAMLMKLSPGRRVLLLLAVGSLLLVPKQYETDHGSGTTVAVGILSPGVILLFVLLALELADRVTMKRDLEIAREIQR
jgi:sigma-B regulation protein RsbU (phosphoserine phosphatase)